MPELPEVETVKKTLLPHWVGQKIINLTVHDATVLRNCSKKALQGRLHDSTLQNLQRYGKILLATFDNQAVLLLHLGMTGQLTVFDPQRESTPFTRHPHTGLERTLQHQPDQHTHIHFTLSSGKSILYRDIRKFGRWYLFQDSEQAWSSRPLSQLGMEPFSPAFLPETFIEKARASNRAIKALLLDQSFVAGIGNIYADEALFDAGILPTRRGKQISKARLLTLYQSVLKVLEKGIVNQGTSLKDYLDAEGNQGQNQESLQVYGRATLDCFNCSQTLKKTQVSQRTTVYCSNCQR